MVDGERYDFHLVGLPVAIVVPENRRLARLRLELELELGGGGPEPPLAYDLFPRTEWTEVQHEHGAVSVDVGKALTFALPPLAGALGLRIELPLRYTTRTAKVQAAGLNTRRVTWDVKDKAILEGFVGHLIVRAPKRLSVALAAALACELRGRGPFGRMVGGRFRSDDERYHLGE